jgi:hypothetical protein
MYRFYLSIKTFLKKIFRLNMCSHLFFPFTNNLSKDTD